MQMDVLVESIFPMTANALDTLIGGVEVERLAGVQLTTLPTVHQRTTQEMSMMMSLTPSGAVRYGSWLACKHRRPPSARRILSCPDMGRDQPKSLTSCMPYTGGRLDHGRYGCWPAVVIVR